MTRNFTSYLILSVHPMLVGALLQSLGKYIIYLLSVQSSLCSVPFNFSAFDMLYAFFLFWPANVIPLWLLCSLLQLFIPLNMLLRSCCIGLKHYKIHVLAGVVIFLAISLAMYGAFDSRDTDQELYYSCLFLLCSLFDVLSHAIKEAIVRSQPLNQENFNYKISVAQLVVGVVITPLILLISKNYEDYDADSAINDPKDMPLTEFMSKYLSEGFGCLVMFNDSDDTCNFVFFYLIGYVCSLFGL